LAVDQRLPVAGLRYAQGNRPCLRLCDAERRWGPAKFGIAGTPATGADCIRTIYGIDCVDSAWNAGESPQLR